MKSRKGIQAAFVLVLLVGLLSWYYLLSAGSTDPPIDSTAHEQVEKPSRQMSATTAGNGFVPHVSRPRVASVDHSVQNDDSEVVFTATWGGGPDQLGRHLPGEGAPEGPMSFALDEGGRYHVLDQINARIQVFESGKPPRSIPLSGGKFQDLAIDGEGNRLLLDRLGDTSITRLDPDGRFLGKIDLVGPGVPEGGAITGMFAKEDGIWVEVSHQRMVRVADADGNPDPDRPVVPGRFTPDGNWILSAALARPYGAAVFRQPADDSAQAPELLARVRFRGRVAHLITLASDMTGRVFIAAHLIELREEAPFDVVASREEVVILAQDGRELERHTLPAAGGEVEQFRAVEVGPDGAVHQLLLGDNGATMRRWM